MNLYIATLIIGIECSTCLIYAEQKENSNISKHSVKFEKITKDNHIQELEAKAIQGDSTAQCALAISYGKGDGVPINYDKAFYRATKAAQNNDPQSYPILFTCYSRGLGCRQDTQKALECLKKGAEAGIAFCQANLAVCLYYGGQGLPIDAKQAVELAVKASRQGDVEAIGLLGDAYFTGNGVDKNMAKALAYLQQGASSGSSNAQYALSRLLRSGNEGVPQDVPQALQWLQKSASSGNGNAQYELGMLLMSGDGGLKKDIPQGVRWLQKSADQGHFGAQNNLGLLYHNGEGVERNEQTAFQWIKASAMQNHPLAQYNLAGLYMQGLGVVKNYKEAAKWYQSSAQQGQQEALFLLGQLYLTGGPGLEKDWKSALKWLN